MTQTAPHQKPSDATRAHTLEPQAATTIPDSATLSDDAFLGDAIRLYQPKEGYRAGIDAVLLAATISAKHINQRPNASKPNILDVGAGVGAVGLCAAQRISSANVTLVERNAYLAAIAEKNIKRNSLNDRAQVIAADISAPAAELDQLGLARESFDFVLANPPFHTEGHGTPAKSQIKSAAHAMPDGQLEQWLRFMTRMCKPGATATLIHKASALDELLAAMHRRFGAITVVPVHPRTNTPANRIIVSGVKGSRAQLSISPGLTVHADDNTYTARMDAIFRHGAELDATG